MEDEENKEAGRDVYASRVFILSGNELSVFMEAAREDGYLIVTSFFEAAGLQWPSHCKLSMNGT